MTALLCIVIGLALAGQDAGSPAEPVTTLPPVDVTARDNQGVVVLECRANPDGSTGDCMILSETPAGQGFGPAALESARRSRLDRATLRGVPPDGTVRFTIRFRLAD